MNMTGKNAIVHGTLSGTQDWCHGRGPCRTGGCRGMEPDACSRCKQQRNLRPDLYIGDDRLEYDE